MQVGQRTVVTRKRNSLQTKARHRRLLSSKPNIIGRPKGIQVEINTSVKRKTDHNKSTTMSDKMTNTFGGRIVNGLLSQSFTGT